MQQHGGAHANRVALHGRNDNLGEIVDGLNEMGSLPRFTGLGIQEIHQVVTGTERLALPSEQHHVNIITLLCSCQQLDQIPVHGAGQRIQFVRTVQGNFHH